jgi:hypothetical protein
MQPGPTEVIDGRFGSVIMLVNELIEDGVTPLAEVEDRLRQRAGQRLRRAMRSFLSTMPSKTPAQAVILWR